MKTLEERLAQLRAEAARLMKDIRKAEADARNLALRSKKPPSEKEGHGDR